MPLVLVGIAVLLVLAGTAASRVSREARLTKLAENTEAAYQAAEAGFNRVRSLAVQCDGSPTSVNGESETIVFKDQSGVARTGGRYQVFVTGAGPWEVTAVGVYGSGAFKTTRVLKGTFRIKTSGSPCSYRVVQTTYMP